MPALVTELIVPGRFNGPATSGNGGWTSGALAGALALDPCTGCAEACPHDHGEAWPAIEVALRQPPPLDTQMHVECHGEGQGVALTFGGAVIATARQSDTEPTEVEGVDAETARAAMASYAGHTSHPFPTCFACGPGRPDADGLGIFGGRVDDVDGQARLASTWTPDRSLNENWHEYVDDVPRASLPVTWASLDCIGGWAGDLTERMMVLARMTARIDALPVIGEEHVVVGAARGEEGRKVFTASTLYDADGRVVGTAEHLWVQVDPGTFG